MTLALNQVWARLDLVMDPELDEPVTDMGFIEAVSITGRHGRQFQQVEISFRLPTYWCSPELRLSDGRRASSARSKPCLGSVRRW